MLYGLWLDDIPIELLHQNYPISGIDYEIVGELTDFELQEVIKCFASSSVVKRKYKRWLQS